jgi:hypothetical protein
MQHEHTHHKMDPENIHKEDYYTGSEIPMSIKQECHYFIKYIQPHGFKFQDVYEYCSDNTQLGLKSGGIRHRTGRYLKKTSRNKKYADKLRGVSSVKAPQASSALQRLKVIYPSRFLNMSDSSVYSPSSSDSSGPPSPPAPAPAVSHRKNHRSKNYKSADDAEATLVGLFSPLSLSSSKSSKVPKVTKKSNLHAATATHPTPSAVHKLHDGIPSNMSHEKFHCQAMAFNQVFALDHENPHTLPNGILFFKVEGSKVKEKRVRADGTVNVIASSVADKFVLAIQVSNPDSLETTSARLSRDLRGVVVRFANPDKYVHKHRAGVAYEIGLSTIMYAMIR